MINDAINEMKASMEKSLGNLKAGLTKLRTGRATTSMLDAIRVDYYGTLTPLAQVATLSAPEPKLLVIQPWEVPLLKAIETAIQKSDIGLSPMNDGKVIRLKVPELTEERRRDIVKMAKNLAEEGRVAIRMARRDANDFLKDALKEKEISEDENKRAGEQIQKITDDYNSKVDQMVATKEKEIMTI